jgi:iron complex outermembrane receptor protein
MNRDSTKFARKLLSVALGTALAGTAVAQDNAPRRQASALLEEVVVTARKREEGSQDVPISVSAYSAEQIDALKVRNLTNLAVSMPSVVLDDIGTSRGYANFSIRGLGVSSSIPSIDPAVGLIIDGVYLGTNAGVLFDTFDLESIEVLRGPQGTLFGRNVTGGAVLLNTARPTQEFSAKARVAYDQAEGSGGGNYYAMGSVSGGLTDTFAAKLAVYYNDDEGALTNSFDGSDHGSYEQTIIRPSFLWTPSDDLEVLVRYERQDVEADGPSAQNFTNGSGVAPTFANFDRNKHEFSIDEPGFQDLEVDFFNTTINWQVAGGTLTNVFGYRDSYSESMSDIDAQPVWIFHSDTHSTYEQVSNELRWNGLVLDEKLNLTIGTYFFESTLEYDEDRNLLGIALAGTPLAGRPALTQSGGGIVDTESMGLFISGDYDLTPDLQITAGIRFSREEKDAAVTTLTANVNNECYIGRPGGVNYSGPESPCVPDFVDDESWTFVSPKLGFMYQLSENSRMYANWSRGFRSGSYNLRNTEFPIIFGPGPFDQEQVDSFEIGYKTEWDRGRINFAMYQTRAKDMQREVNLPSPVAGVLQLFQNTADATIFGFEVDGTFAVTDAFTLKASMGWLSDDYDKVIFDLNGDGAVDNRDKDLTLPRAPDLTYNITGIYDVDIGSHGYLSSMVSYGYRAETFFTDNNLGDINDQQMLDVAFDYHTNDGHWIFSLYGRNLMNSVLHGGTTQLPAALGPVPLGGTFAPLNKPATYGFEVTYNL